MHDGTDSITELPLRHWSFAPIAVKPAGKCRSHLPRDKDPKLLLSNAASRAVQSEIHERIYL
jgi:hypothetical protein